MNLGNLDKIDLQLNVRTGKFYYIDGNGQFAEFVIPRSVQNGYKSYVALLSQSGTSAPVATVLQNDFDSEIIWAYASQGVYVGTLTGAFTANKNFGYAGATYEGTLPTIFVYNNDVNEYYVETLDEGVNANGLLNGTMVTITVYN